MPRKALIEKAKKTPKFKTRKYTRCFQCGRSRGGPFRKSKLCRIDFRKWVYNGYIPGFKKLSW